MNNWIEIKYYNTSCNCCIDVNGKVHISLDCTIHTYQKVKEEIKDKFRK